MFVAGLDLLNIRIPDFFLVMRELYLLLYKLPALHHILLGEVFQALKAFFAHLGKRFSLLLHQKFLTDGQEIIFGCLEELLGLNGHCL